jgi:trimeric autotransporter adhesin
VALDTDGDYTAVLGATQNSGVPLDLFTASSPRWLGIMFNRPSETEQPRVHLVSVPYAMRAADAETLGGLPASAYLLDPNAATTGNASSGSTTPVSSASAKSLKPSTISGTMNYIPYFTDNSNDLGDSVLYQTGSNVGIGTASPSAPLDLLPAAIKKTSKTWVMPAVA